jgi:hypothetical protein
MPGSSFSQFVKENYSKVAELENKERFKKLGEMFQSQKKAKMGHSSTEVHSTTKTVPKMKVKKGGALMDDMQTAMKMK